jgi:hypothetical protein
MLRKEQKIPRTLDQAKDTGMAFVLLGLIIWLMTKNEVSVIISIGILVITMAVPQLLLPLAEIWFGFSKLLGMVTSKIVLTLVFISIVLPVGMVRKWARQDTLQLNAFKKKRISGFVDRNHRYSPNDLLNPY